ncbi:hypothetical protein FQR65_LT20984 [Abscondita terminalis]|nr:hypothetical protein FQR65_LT20984 [Abscondita terminalis]
MGEVADTVALDVSRFQRGPAHGRGAPRPAQGVECRGATGVSRHALAEPRATSVPRLRCGAGGISGSLPTTKVSRIAFMARQTGPHCHERGCRLSPRHALRGWVLAEVLSESVLSPGERSPGCQMRSPMPRSFERAMARRHWGLRGAGPDPGGNLLQPPGAFRAYWSNRYEGKRRRWVVGLAQVAAVFNDSHRGVVRVEEIVGAGAEGHRLPCRAHGGGRHRRASGRNAGDAAQADEAARMLAVAQPSSRKMAACSKQRSPPAGMMASRSPAAGRAVSCVLAATGSIVAGASGRRRRASPSRTARPMPHAVGREIQDSARGARRSILETYAASIMRSSCRRCPAPHRRASGGDERRPSKGASPALLRVSRKAVLECIHWASQNCLAQAPGTFSPSGVNPWNGRPARTERIGPNSRPALRVWPGSVRPLRATGLGCARPVTLTVQGQQMGDVFCVKSIAPAAARLFGYSLYPKEIQRKSEWQMLGQATDLLRAMAMAAESPSAVIGMPAMGLRPCWQCGIAGMAWGGDYNPQPCCMASVACPRRAALFCASSWWRNC